MFAASLPLRRAQHKGERNYTPNGNVSGTPSCGSCAFSGSSARDSYRVTCDRSTMTAGDIDAGRVRCDVVLNPASPIHRIAVNLALIEPPAVPTQSEAA